MGANDGAIYGAIGGTVAAIGLIPFILVKTNKDQARGKYMVLSAEGSLIYIGGYQDAYNHTLNVLKTAKIKILDANPGQYYIYAGVPFNFLTTGFTIVVKFYSEANHIRTVIKIGPTSAMIDFGKSKKLMAKIMEEWNRR